MIILSEPIISSWAMTIGEFSTILVAGLAPIIVFTLGIRIEKRKQKAKDATEKKKIKDIVWVNAVRSATVLEDVKAKLEEFCNTLHIDNDAPFSFYELDDTPMQTNISVGFDRVLFAFREDIDDSNLVYFINFWEVTNRSVKNIKLYKESYLDFIANYRKLDDEFQNLLHEVLKEVVALKRRLVENKDDGDSNLKNFKVAIELFSKEFDKGMAPEQKVATIKSFYDIIVHEPFMPYHKFADMPQRIHMLVDIHARKVKYLADVKYRFDANAKASGIQASIVKEFNRRFFEGRTRL